MKIAIIASENGEKALYLHDFFKEGNRIAVDCLLTDNPESAVARRMREEGIDVIFMTPGQQMVELSELLKNRDVELLVVDDYSGDVPSELKEAFGEAIVYPSVKEKAPLEVIETTDRLKARQTAAAEPAASASESASEGEGEDQGEETPTPEQEWAEVLEIDVEQPKDEQPREEQPPVYPGVPPQYGQQPPQYGQQPPYPYGQQPSYTYGQQPQYGPQPPYGQTFGRPHLSEPMPDNYLLWSVLLTIFCCLIPGIIAIVYSASVSSKYYAGDLDGAKRASRNAQIWCIVSVIAGVIWATLYIPLTLFLS